MIISENERMIPINTPLIVPRIRTPKNAPAKVRHSVRLTFHNRAARSNSVAPRHAEITLAVSTGIGRYPINPVPQSNSTIIDSPATIPVS